LVKKLAAAISSFDKKQIDELERNGEITTNVEGESVTLTTDDVEIVRTEIEGWVVESEEGITVAIDSELTEDLIAEGYAREFVNRIQNMRKDNGFDVIDRIRISLDSDEKLFKYIDKFSDYIKTETLADSIEKDKLNNQNEKVKIGDYDCVIEIEKSN
jgi:isoleucyl-tRNA synthetase